VARALPDASAQLPPMLEPPPVVHRPPLGARIEAPSDAAVMAIAVTREGDAALTVDEKRGMRLWPTFDGTHEPCVVDLPGAAQLVLARRGAGFIAALRDDADGLVIAQLDDGGRVRARATVATDPPVVGIAAIEAGVLAWRADETLALYGDEGQMLARLAAEPSERVLAVSATQAGAVAIVLATSESGGTTAHARALVARGQTLAWGAATTAALPADGELAVSPNGAYLAQLLVSDTSTPGAAVVYEIATGREVARAPADRGAAITFADDAHAVVVSESGETWIPVDGTRPTPIPSRAPLFRSPRESPAVAGGHGVVIIGAVAQLVFSTGRDAEYLGYGFAFARLAGTDGHGQIVLAGNAPDGTTLVHVDRDLRATRVLAVPAARLVGIAPLGKDWIVEAARGSSVVVTTLDVAAGALGSNTPLSTSGPIAAEPTTDLVGVSGDAAALLRYDPTTRAIAGVTIARDTHGNRATLFPVDPALAGGVRVVRLAYGDKIHAAWLRDETRPAASEVAIDGRIISVDRAGHVYIHERTDRDRITVYADGTRVAQLPEGQMGQAWPDPTGTRVVLRTQHGLALYTLAGALVWQREANTQLHPTWIDDATLLLVGNGGVLRLDPATGALAAARCGWDFQRSAKPLQTPGRMDAACTQPP
jgi:hypothetical protein